MPPSGRAGMAVVASYRDAVAKQQKQNYISKLLTSAFEDQRMASIANMLPPVRPPWRGPRRARTKANLIEGKHLVYGFLTCEPNSIVAPVHAEAMPVTFSVCRPPAKVTDLAA